MVVCGAAMCESTGDAKAAVVEHQNALSGEWFPLCERCAAVMRMLDNTAREGYRAVGDPRADREAFRPVRWSA